MGEEEQNDEGEFRDEHHDDSSEGESGEFDGMLKFLCDAKGFSGSGSDGTDGTCTDMFKAEAVMFCF